MSGAAGGSSGVARPERGRPRRRVVLVAGATAVAGAGAGIAWATGPGQRPDRPHPASLVIATGPQGAVFLEVGRDLARAITHLSPGTAVRTPVTAASVDNLRLLAGSAADLGLASLDAAAVDPQVGAGRILATSRLYDSFLHLVVPAASSVRELRGCAGLRVGVGATGSGTEFTGLRLLRLAGVRPAVEVRLGQVEAMAALARGTLDAAFSLTGFPTPAITDLAARTAVRLVPLGEHVAALDAAFPGIYRAGSVPEGTYRGVTVTETAYVPNLLLARPGLDDDTVTLVIEALLSEASRRFRTHPDSRRIDVRTAIATAPVPLHPAALRWFRAQKP